MAEIGRFSRQGWGVRGRKSAEARDSIKPGGKPQDQNEKDLFSPRKRATDERICGWPPAIQPSTINGTWFLPPAPRALCLSVTRFLGFRCALHPGFMLSPASQA